MRPGRGGAAPGGSAFAARRGRAAAGADGRAGAEVCYRLTSETIEGPYYIDADKIRRDITEDSEGIPLLLRLKVIDSDTCKPIRNAAVDIWHCDAAGVYSGYENQGNGGGGGRRRPPANPRPARPRVTPPGTRPAVRRRGGGHQEPTDDARYLRGTWRTDRHGQVAFKTIFPGWYQGRCVHIHTKVHVDGEWTDAGYEGGHTCHTGQFFFDEESVLASAEVEPYSDQHHRAHHAHRGHHLRPERHPGGLLKLRYDKRDITKGVHASLTVGVDPESDGGRPGRAAPDQRVGVASASAS